MLYLKILSIAIPYLVLSYFAWKEFRNKNYYTGTQLVWTLITIMGYFIYLCLHPLAFIGFAVLSLIEGIKYFSN